MKRRPVDSWFWELYKHACGKRCCACHTSGVKLERGHIIPHAQGGRDDMENLLPVCLPCNKKYLKKQTPDNRPTDWRERFYLLLGGVLRPQISVSQSKGLCNLIPATKGTENNRVVEWPTQDFDAGTEVFTQSGVSQPEADLLMRNLIMKSRRITTPPKPPYEKRQIRMRVLAANHGKDFLIAGDGFLRSREWVIDEERGTITQDSWQHFCESFPMYLELGLERAVRVAAAEATKRKLDRENAEREKVNLRERYWRDYLLPVTVPDWPAMPDVDREHREAVIADKDNESREVTEENLERSYAVLRHYTHYKKDELLAAKKPLRDMLAQCNVWAKDYDVGGQRKLMDLINPAEEWLDKVNDIQELEDESYRIENNLYNELDPARKEAEAARLAELEQELWKKFTAEPPPGYAAADLQTKEAIWERYLGENILEF